MGLTFPEISPQHRSHCWSAWRQYTATSRHFSLTLQKRMFRRWRLFTFLVRTVRHPTPPFSVLFCVCYTPSPDPPSGTPSFADVGIGSDSLSQQSYTKGSTWGLRDISLATLIVWCGCVELSQPLCGVMAPSSLQTSCVSTGCFTRYKYSAPPPCLPPSLQISSSPPSPPPCRLCASLSTVFACLEGCLSAAAARAHV